MTDRGSGPGAADAPDALDGQASASPDSLEVPGAPGVPGGRAAKKALRADLVAGELDAIAARAEHSHQTLGTLIALTYDGDPAVAWRAVHALGLAAARVARSDPDLVRRYLRRLFWLITEESGGICWFAPQAMAEVARTHASFADFVPITMNLLGEMADEDLQHFRPGILWAIGRLGALAEPHMDDVLADVEAALEHPDPDIRGLAAWALGKVGRGALVAARPALLDDPASVTIFAEGERVDTTVADLAEGAMEGSG